MKKTGKLITLTLFVALTFMFGACREVNKKPVETPVILVQTTSAGETAPAPQQSEPEEPSETEETKTKKGDIVILVTSDVHCAPHKGFGYAGLYRIREKFKKEGCKVLLVDDGDEIEGHGELFGAVTQGEQVIDMMNKMGYDVATLGNHDFAYGYDRLMQMVKKAKFDYVSCNIYRNGKLILKPYVIKNVGGKKIAFLGATTPRTIGVYLSKSIFMNDTGKIIFDFKGGDKGNDLLKVIQKNVDAARAEGADHVFLLAHIGTAKKYKEYEDIKYIMANTTGIDAILDGHSHDAKKLEGINAEGKPITRIAMGSKLSRIGYVRISAEDGSVETGLYSWTSSVNASELFGIKNKMNGEVDKAFKKYHDTFEKKQGRLKFPLLTTDPEKKDEEGNPVRIIEKAETNLGDFVADAFRVATGADVAIIPADKFGDSLEPGDISMKSMYGVLPSIKKAVVVKATGQQIVDALEWGCRKYPKANAAFLQVSGITFKVDSKTKSTIKSKKGYFIKVRGKRKVSHVKINGQPIDLKKKYTVVSYMKVLRASEYGFNMFKGCKRVKTDSRLDFQILSDFLKKNLKGNVPDRYKNPAGQNRIHTS